MPRKKNSAKMQELTGDFQEYLINSLKNPEKAAAYLQVALEEYQEDRNAEVFMMALRDVAEAMGGLGELSKTTNLNRQNLYQTLSAEGNPRLTTLGAILNGLGFQLSVVPLAKSV